MTDKPTVPNTVELAALLADVDDCAYNWASAAQGCGHSLAGAHERIAEDTAKAEFTKALARVAAWNKRASASTPAPIPQPCEWSLALQSLTPGGSEYVDDPARCVAFVRDTRTSQHETIKRQQKQLNELRVLNERSQQ